MTTTLGALRAPHTRISIIGAASALGAPHAGSAAAPAVLQGGTLARHLAAIGPSVEWTQTLLPSAAERAAGPASDAPSAADTDAATAMATRIAANAGFARRLADHIDALPAGNFPLVLGGDHAIAAGTWRARVRQLRSQVLVFARANFQKCHDNSANCSGAAGFSIPKA